MRFGFDYYENVNPPIWRIGITQFEHGFNRPDYFASVRAAYEKQDGAIGNLFNPVARLQERLSEVFPSHSYIAYEEQLRSSYSAGQPRQINIALLHVDWAPLNVPGWEISRCISQLAWSLYIRVPDACGDCIVHDGLWLPEQQRRKVPHSYGYDHKLLDGCDNVVLRSVVGDLLLFNSQYFHEVQPGGIPVDRPTISSFIGVMPEGYFVL